MTRRSRPKSHVVVTANFEQNLVYIRRFLERAEARQRFDALLDDLLDRVVPLLERTPRIGAPIDSQALSHEGALLLERIQERLEGRELRRLVRGDFVVLYLVSKSSVQLLAVKHHRERLFQFGRRR